ncbi:hypothetical protein [Streptomyces sp. T028]|uniref:hypothetical protein n=1 Tax=Streptomyces sp. T028 TaxID=3394379 RepID=UPI003A859A89
MDREQRVCPVCGQPVQSVVQRYKTLGAWVPRWVPGPCHNPECEAHVEEGTLPHHEERTLPHDEDRPLPEHEEATPSEHREKPGAQAEPTG